MRVAATRFPKDCKGFFHYFRTAFHEAPARNESKTVKIIKPKASKNDTTIGKAPVKVPNGFCDDFLTACRKGKARVVKRQARKNSAAARKANSNVRKGFFDGFVKVFWEGFGKETQKVPEHVVKETPLARGG